MTEIDRRLPSIPEVLELASLVPSQKPPSPDVHRLLQPFIDLCRPQWVSDFLFTPDPIHLEHFLSPTFASKSFVCAYKTTRIEAASLQPDPEPLYEETHHLDGRYLFLPAFTAGGITLGFGAMEIMANTGPFWHSDLFRRCGACLPLRFVRDAKRNTLLEIMDIPQDDAVMVFLTRYISPSRTHSVNALFNRSQLLHSLRQSSNSVVLRSLHASLRFINEEDQIRACHICHASSPAMCICALNAVAPLHPFDANNFANSMMQHLGVHQSLSHKLLFDSGIQRRHVVMGSRMYMQGSNDPGFVQRIASWVATNYVNGTIPSPRVAVPLVSDHVRELGDIFTLEEHQLGISHKPSNARKVVSDENLLQTLIDDVIEQQEFGPVEMQEVPTVQLQRGLQTESEPPLDGIDITSAGLPEVQPLHSGYVFTVSSGADEGVQDDWWAERCNKQIADAFQESLIGLAPGSDEITFRPTPTPPSAESHSVNGDIISSSLVEEARSAPALPSAESEINANPSTGSEIVSGGAGSSSVRQETPGPDEKLIAKRLKAQQRRERNRLCAQRSNMRAKAMRDALKADLQSSKEKVEMLRSKEMALRQENLALRKSMTEQM